MPPPATQFVHRTSPLGGATFSQTLVFGFLGNPQAPLEELAETAATLGVPITPQALDQRLTPAAAACLEQVLRAAIQVIAADPVAIPLLERFTAVAVQDSSTIVLPDALAAVWQGCGGTTTSGTTAALKLQVRLELRTGQLEGPALQDGRASDRAALLPTTLPAGALWLADLGIGAWTHCRRWTSTGCAGCRGSSPARRLDTTGQQRDLLALLRHSPPRPWIWRSSWARPTACRPACWLCECRRPSPMSGGAGCARRPEEGAHGRCASFGLGGLDHAGDERAR